MIDLRHRQKHVKIIDLNTSHLLCVSPVLTTGDIFWEKIWGSLIDFDSMLLYTDRETTKQSITIKKQ